MNLNDRLLWHFLENHCTYFVTAGRGYAFPASSVWIYSIPPFPSEFRGFFCVIAIKEHQVFARIDYGIKDSTPDYMQVLSKEWKRRSFNLFKLIEWIESAEVEVAVQKHAKAKQSAVKVERSSQADLLSV